MNQQPCLIELFTEELPPKALLKLRDSFNHSIQTQLKQAGFEFSGIKAFATPRRLALLIDGLHETQPDQTIERKGPALVAAYDKDGNPTPACTGFAASCGIAIDQLDTLKTDKGEWLFCKVNKKGEHIQQLLPQFIITALKQLPVPKFMRWGNNDFQFARPVHNLIVMFGKKVIEMDAYGCRSNNQLHGHRFMAPEPITLQHPEHYEQTLENEAYVIADFDRRQQMIRDGINDSICREFNEGANAVIHQALLDEVTALVEWPQALIVPFDPQFLSVPEEALISSMEQHQKCFALKDNNNQLLPFFITISNIHSNDPTAVISGNERVMHARLSDAAFFYQTDCSRALSSYTEQLKTITYEKTLGSLHDKVTRIQQLSNSIASLTGANQAFTQRAAELCKSDLVTLMVEEFPELQGIMGKYYANNDDEPAPIAEAIVEHYLPRHAGDYLPHSAEGLTIALADRLDTLVGIFGIGHSPTGDKDPFALRRASLGILRLLIEKELSIDLSKLIDQAIAQYPENVLTQTDLKTQLLQFFSDRLRSYALDHHIEADVFLSVNATHPTNPLKALNKMKAVTYFKTTPEAESLAAANKRVSNILKKQAIAEAMTLDNALLTEPAEAELAQHLETIQNNFQALIDQDNYEQALLLLTELNQPINQFFDQVMVMAEDTAVKNNRIALLQKVRAMFLKIADIALLQ